MKHDIAQNIFYIRQLINVVMGHHHNVRKPRHISIRHCDAFTYTLSGKSWYRFEDGTEYTVQAGDIMFVSRDARYAVEILEAPYDFIFCDFLFDGGKYANAAFTLPETGSMQRICSRSCYIPMGIHPGLRLRNACPCCMRSTG